MSTLGNAVAVLIFCLPLSLSALLYHHLPIKEASAEPVQATVREEFLVAQSCFSTQHQGKGGYWWSPQRYQEVEAACRNTVDTVWSFLETLAFQTCPRV